MKKGILGAALAATIACGWALVPQAANAYSFNVSLSGVYDYSSIGTNIPPSATPLGTFQGSLSDNNYASTLTFVNLASFRNVPTVLAARDNDSILLQSNFDYNQLSIVFQVDHETYVKAVSDEDFTFDDKNSSVAVAKLYYTGGQNGSPQAGVYQLANLEYSATANLQFIAPHLPVLPLPASAPMFGAALLGLASVGYAARRKREAGQAA